MLCAPPSCRQGTPEEMESYLQRLRERGFEVSPTLKKALQTGVRVCKQVRAPAAKGLFR